MYYHIEKHDLTKLNSFHIFYKDETFWADEKPTDVKSFYPRITEQNKRISSGRVCLNIIERRLFFFSPPVNGNRQ